MPVDSPRSSRLSAERWKPKPAAADARCGVAIGAAFAALLIVLVVVSQLWMRSRASEQRAVQQTLRTEAQQLFALGQVEEDGTRHWRSRTRSRRSSAPTRPEIRRFALRQLWKGPLAFVGSEGSNGGVSSLAFSPMANGWRTRGTDPRVWRRDGSGPFERGRSFLGNATAHFVGDGRRLAIFGRRSSGTVGCRCPGSSRSV